VEETIRYVATLVTLSLWFSIVGFVAMAAICARIVWLTRDVPARTRARRQRP
jgi:hypothetical protein